MTQEIKDAVEAAVHDAVAILGSDSIRALSWFPSNDTWGGL